MAKESKEKEEVKEKKEIKHEKDTKDNTKQEKVAKEHEEKEPKDYKKKEKKEHEDDESEELVDKVSNKFWIFMGLIIVLALIAFGVKYYMGPDGPGQSGTDNMSLITGEGSVELEFYVMSQCPYGLQVEDSIAPVLKTMGENIKFTIDFIAQDMGEGKFKSLHGQPEVDENIRQLCAIKYNPDEYMDFIICQNKDINNAEKNFDDCADSAGLDTESVNACAEGEEGAGLLSESIERSQEREARGSPTIYLNGEEYQGKRDTESFQSAICNEIDHPACSEVSACSDDTDCSVKEGKIAKCLNPGTSEAECTYSEPVKVYMVVLNDKECQTCDTTRIIMVTEQLFPGVVIENVDISTEEGKAVADAYGLTYLPAYIFSSELEDTNTWQANSQIRGSFEKVGDNYKLMDAATGANHFIDEEKRKEQEEMLNNYPKQNLKVMGYDSDKPRVDYFVMAFCPYGNPADEAASELYKLFGAKVEIVPHYIISVSGDKIQSLHGEQEGNQGVRELCALEELGYEDFFKFTLEVNKMCNSGNADTCWESAAKRVGVDVEAIEDCESSRKLNMAMEQGDVISQLKTMSNGQLVTPLASPTFLINGKTYDGSRDAESIKQALCAAFDKAPEECSEQVESASTAAASSGACN